MPTYVTLFKWTDQGARTVKETVDRADQATAGAQQMGGRITGLYWTQGVYDVIAVSEWPDEESAQAFLLRMASQGAVRSESLRAFTKEEMRRILGKVR